MVFSGQFFYETEVMITSLIEMLALPNFGHMTKSIIQVHSHGKVLLVRSETEFMTS